MPNKYRVLLVAVVLAVWVDSGLCRSAGGSAGQLFGGFSGQENHSTPIDNASFVVPDKFITAGSPTGISQYPWVVYLSTRFQHPKGIVAVACGGSLISSRHVITAAHCVKLPIEHNNNVSVYIGEYNTATFPKDCLGTQCVRNVRMHPDKIIIHPDYESKQRVINDIAMLTFRRPAPSTARPIPLPAFNINDDRYEGTPLIVTGWGKTGADRSVSSIKQHALVQQVAPEACRRYLTVPEGILCAKSSTGQGVCNGDSGGPIMMEHKGRFLLVGIMSYIIDECGGSLPSMYTNVYSYLDWIHQNMKA